MEIAPSLQTSRRRVIESFKRFVLSYKLEPYDAKKANEEKNYHVTFRFYDTDEGARQLYVEKISVERVLSLVERMFPGQIDRTLAQNQLLETLDKWITSEHAATDISKIEALGSQFIEEISKEIHDLIVYVPLYGLNLKAKSFQVGNCVLHPNDGNSPFSKLLDDQKRETKYQQNQSNYLNQPLPH